MLEDVGLAARYATGDSNIIIPLSHISPKSRKALINKMKLIVTGGTGFVGSEVIRQAVRNPAITSVIAIARKPVTAPPNAGPGVDTSKLTSIVLEDWISPYPESVKELIQGADGCIWFVQLQWFHLLDTKKLTSLQSGHWRLHPLLLKA